jgi:branched-chain amino acid transport system permease protein
MAVTSPSEPSLGDRRRSRLSAFRPTPRFRAQLLQALILAAIFVGSIGTLSLVFGVTILQYALGGMVISSIVIVAAIGLTVLYGIRGFANFAYGDIMTLGAYVALLLAFGGVSMILGAIVTFLALAMFGIFLELVIFSRLEGRGPVPPIVASVGVGLIIQNGIRAIAGTQKWLYPVPPFQDIMIAPGLGIHPIRGILTLGVGLSLVLSAHVLLKYTNLGKAMRATADNLELAKATGIDTKRVTYAAWAVSCSFASVAGVLLGLGSAISPTMGFESLLLIFAAVIVGGIGSPYGAMLGGLLVGLSQEMSVPLLVWLQRPDVIGLQFGTAYKVAVPFIILILVLIFRPWGIAGRKPAFARRAFVVERITRAFRERLATTDGKAAEKGAGKSWP